MQHRITKIPFTIEFVVSTNMQRPGAVGLHTNHRNLKLAWEKPGKANCIAFPNELASNITMHCLFWLIV